MIKSTTDVGWVWQSIKFKLNGSNYLVNDASEYIQSGWGGDFFLPDNWRT